MLQLMPQGIMNLRNLQDWESRTIPHKLYNNQSKKNTRYHSRIRDQGPQTCKLKNARKYSTHVQNDSWPTITQCFQRLKFPLLVGMPCTMFSLQDVMFGVMFPSPRWYVLHHVLSTQRFAGCHVHVCTDHVTFMIYHGE